MSGAGNQGNSVSNDEVTKLFQQILDDKRIEAAANLQPAANDQSAQAIKKVGEELLKLKVLLNDPNAEKYNYDGASLHRSFFIPYVANKYKNFNTEVAAALNVNLGAPPNRNSAAPLASGNTQQLNSVWKAQPPPVRSGSATQTPLGAARHRRNISSPPVLDTTTASASPVLPVTPTTPPNSQSSTASSTPEGSPRSASSQQQVPVQPTAQTGAAQAEVSKNKYEGLSLKDITDKLGAAKAELGHLQERERNILFHIEKFEKDNKIKDKEARKDAIPEDIKNIDKPKESAPPPVKAKYAESVKKLEDEQKALSEQLEKDKAELAKLKGTLTDHTGKKEEVVIVDEQKKVEKLINDKKAEIEQLQEAMQQCKEDMRLQTKTVAQNDKNEKVNFLDDKKFLKDAAAQNGCSCDTALPGICKMISNQNKNIAITIEKSGVSTPANCSKEALELQAKVFIELRLKNNLPIGIEHVNIQGANAADLIKIYKRQVKELEQKHTTINSADNNPENDKKQTPTNISGADNSKVSGKIGDDKKPDDGNSTPRPK